MSYGTLKVHATPPAENNKANSALRALLAETLNISIRNVKITKGENSQRKVIAILNINNIIISVLLLTR